MRGRVLPTGRQSWVLGSLATGLRGPGAGVGLLVDRPTWPPSEWYCDPTWLAAGPEASQHWCSQAGGLGIPALVLTGWWAGHPSTGTHRLVGWASQYWCSQAVGWASQYCAHRLLGWASQHWCSQAGGLGIPVLCSQAGGQGLVPAPVSQREGSRMALVVEQAPQKSCCQCLCPQGEFQLPLASLRGSPGSAVGLTQTSFK